jgi:1-acyl-sn-glycerol-3-phosphate acyltransferase
MSKKQKRKNKGPKANPQPGATPRAAPASTTPSVILAQPERAQAPIEPELDDEPEIPLAPDSTPAPLPIASDIDDPESSMAFAVSGDPHIPAHAPPPLFDAGEMPPSSAAPPSNGRLVPGYDLDAEAALNIAPIGPTEPGAMHPTMPPEARPEDEEPEATSAPTTENIEEQIRALEARLDQMIGQERERHGQRETPAQAGQRLGAPPGEPGSAPKPPPAAPKKSEPAPGPAPHDQAPEDATAREVLSSDFYARQWGRAGMRSRSEEVDEFGLDPSFEARIQPALDFIYKYYFRVETEGSEHIPAEGRCLLVSNHSGGPLPYDGAMLRTAVRREHAAKRDLRWLAEDFIYYLPFVGTVMNRMGAVRACQENAERLLGRGALVAVFPEGAKGIGKLFRDRYRLQRFGRGGFIRLCLRTRTPLVPCAIVGAEEANPMLYRVEYMTEALGIPYFPITPTFPALGPLGLLPAPTKWKIRFGEPMHWGNYGPEAADDEILVGRLSERVRATIQGMLDQMVSKRRSIWLG